MQTLTHNFMALTPSLLLIGGWLPYCLSEFSPVPALGCAPKYFCFKRYTANNLNKYERSPQQVR